MAAGEPHDRSHPKDTRLGDSERASAAADTSARADERDRMVERQLASRGIADPRVLEAMRSVPRELFVPEPFWHDAYADRPLPIEAAQTISQPYIVALMIEAAALAPDDRALEVGAGSGYATAVMSRVAREVVGIERHRELAEQAAERLQRLGYGNAEVRCGDGSAGCPERAPFDAIVVSASGPRVPDVLLAQLAPGGRLVMPVGGEHFAQRLVKVTRRADAFEEEDLGGVAFVPLIGTEGWPDRGRAFDDEP